jgi:hypothetical protein
LTQVAELPWLTTPPPPLPARPPPPAGTAVSKEAAAAAEATAAAAAAADAAQLAMLEAEGKAAGGVDGQRLNEPALGGGVTRARRRLARPPGGEWGWLPWFPWD